MVRKKNLAWYVSFIKFHYVEVFIMVLITNYKKETFTRAK